MRESQSDFKLNISIDALGEKRLIADWKKRIDQAQKRFEASAEDLGAWDLMQSYANDIEYKIALLDYNPGKSYALGAGDSLIDDYLEIEGQVTKFEKKVSDFIKQVSNKS